MRRESRCFTLSLLSVWEDEHILIFVLSENKVEFSRPVATRALTERKGKFTIDTPSRYLGTRTTQVNMMNIRGT